MAVLGLGLVVWLFVLRPRPEVPPPKVNGAEASGAATVASGTAGQAGDRAAGAPTSAHPTSTVTSNSLPQFGVDEERAEQIRAGLQNMVASSSGGGGPSPLAATPGPGEVGEEAALYAQTLVAERFGPVVGQCYEGLLREKPAAEGKVALQFSVMGTEQTGAVVVDAVFGEGTTLRDEALEKCVLDGLYALIFEPPPPGHPVVSVTQILELSP